MARPRPSSRTLRRRNAAVIGLCVLAGFGALVADGAPAGLAGVDAFLRVAFAVALTLAAAQARRSAWATASGLAVIAASRDATLFFAALVVFAVAVVASVKEYRNRVVGAAVGAATAQVLLRLPHWGPTGMTALVGAASAMVLVVSGVRALRRRARRRVLVAAAIAGGFALVLTAGFAVSILLGRSDLQAGIDAARAGVTAARSGNTALAIKRFDEAGRDLRSAASRLDSPYSRAARIVPVVGQHEEALRTLVADAADLASTGALAAREANVDALRFTDGRLDPARVAALRDPLARVSRALASTARDLRSIRSPWLVGPMQSGVDDLANSVRRATHDARTASLAVRASPRLLGTAKPTSYFVMFVTPSEARAGGGFMGNWAILTVTDGRFEMSQFGRSSDLNAAGDAATKHLDGLADYLARYGRFSPARDWRNVNLSPDFPTVAEAVRQLSPQSGGAPVDGVLAFDPTGLAALLKLTGPVSVEGLAQPLTAQHAAQFLLKDQYVAFGSTTQRVDFLDEAAHTVIDRLIHSTLPGPRAIGRALGPAAHNGHILASFFDADGERFFERLGVAGERHRTAGDTFGLVTQNASANKIELFLHRSVNVETTVDPGTGHTTSTAEIRLRNDAPTSGLPDYVIANAVPGLPIGSNRLYLSLYTTLALADATLDGAPVQLESQTENGLAVYSAFLTVPAGTEAVLRVRLEGANRFVTDSGHPAYRLDLWRQTTVNPDKVSVRVHLPARWHFGSTDGGFVAAGSTAGYSGAPGRDMTLVARIES